MQVCGNLRQPQWAIKVMGNLVMPIKSGGGQGKNREMKQNVILMHETVDVTIILTIIGLCLVNIIIIIVFIIIFIS